jgi:hypothetical protein
MRHSHIRIRCRLPSRTRTPPASRNASSYPCSGPVVLVTGLILVGRRGVEPRDTCLSGRPRRPAGSRPADGGGPDPQTAALSRPASNGRLPPGRFTIQERRAGDSNASAVRRPTAFGAVPAPWQVHSPRAEDGEIESQCLTTPIRVPAAAGALPGSSPIAESGAIEAHAPARDAHSLAARPGPWPVHSPSCAGRESNPHVRRHTLLRRARLPITPPAHDLTHLQQWSG